MLSARRVRRHSRSARGEHRCSRVQSDLPRNVSAVRAERDVNAGAKLRQRAGTLLHTCGAEAMPGKPIPDFSVDSWTVASPALQKALIPDGEAIICWELGTRYPAAA
jgi:hypothetical protein